MVPPEARPLVDLDSFDNQPYVLEPRNLDEMRREAMSLLYKSTGLKRVDSEWFEVRDGQTQMRRSKERVATLVPTPQQLGLRKTIEQSETAMVGDESVRFDGDEIGDRRRGTRTFAVLNHPLLHADGPRSTGVTIAAVAASSAILASSALIAAPLKLIEKSPADRTGMAASIIKELGFPETHFSIAQCINVGTPILLGLNRPINNAADVVGILGQVLGDVAASLISPNGRTPLVESPLFYLHMFRTILDGISEIDAAASTLASRPNIGSFREFVDRIKSLGSIRFLALAAQLGDAALKRQREIIGINPDENALSAVNASGYRGVGDRPMRSLINSGTGGGFRQSSSLRDLPSAWIPPTSIRNERKHINVLEKYQPALGPDAKNVERNRVLRDLGEALEAEQLPFWIQDMRTSEVTAFHAFLTSVSDSFAPNVIPEQTIGRMDPVMLFSNTTRTISLSFLLFATSPDEHDTLWSIINWLTMLVYPTWSEGIVVDSESQRTSPFGRVPAASPLIRLRLADVIRSNAGSESISRLLRTADSLRREEQERGSLDNEIVSVRSDVRDNFDLETGTEYFLFPNTLGYFVESRAPRDAAGIVQSLTRSESRNLKGRVLKTNKRLYFVPTKITDNGRSALGQVFEVDKDGTKGQPLPFVIDGDEITDFVVRASKSDLFPAEISRRIGSEQRALERIAPSAAATAFTNFDRAARSFERLSQPFSNRAERKGLDDFAFVKALRNGALDGLAGMLTSFEIDYNWSDQSNFGLELESGSIAPLGVQVNLSMQVVHDIQPGKDVRGVNRAPIYNVGGPANDSVGDFQDDANRSNEDSSGARRGSGVARSVASAGRQFAEGLTSAFRGDSGDDGAVKNSVPKGDGRNR